MDDRRFDQLARSLAEARSRRHVLKGLAGGVMALALAALRPDRGLAAPKVRVCHLTGSASNPVELIEVSVDAIPAHEAHGDVIDPDFQNDPTNCGGCLISCDDGNSCTIDTCSGGSCVHTPKVCDQPAECQEPGICDPATGNCEYAFKANSVVCRPAAGPCDLAESCTGNSATCPPDAFQPNTVPCRVGSCADGVATLPANCLGDSAACPAAQTQHCGPFACGPTACHPTCTDDAQCAAGHHCDDGQCLPDEELGAACDEDDDCQSGFCVNGICCNERCAGECDQCTAATNGICTSANSDTTCGAGGGQVCCNGACCAAGESCAGDTCQAPCLELQAACDPANDHCCDDEGTICDATTCTPETARCCRPVGAACSGTCDCCDGAVCLEGQCRPFCIPGGESCGEDDECCSGACSVTPDCGIGFVDVRCCHGAGEDCSFACECCSGLTCSPEEICCAPAGATCESFIECCGGDCRNGSCCASNGRVCAETSDCCEGEGLVCREGLCRPEVCLPLQEVCIFDDDCCGDDSLTFCRVACDSLRTCCSTTPGPCTENCDCCGDDNCVLGSCCHAVGGDACTDDDECCGEAVCRGFPIQNQKCCHPTGAACGPVPGGGATCCESNLCVPRGPLGIQECVACTGDFNNIFGTDRCTAETLCCSGFCHLPSGNCCRTEGDRCSKIGALNFECCLYHGLTCSGENGTCIPCRGLGETCDGTDTDSTCCLGSGCRDGRCVQDFCSGLGSPCQHDSVCCPGFLCNVELGRCEFFCAAEGVSCTLGCCDGLICDPPNINGVCRRP